MTTYKYARVWVVEDSRMGAGVRFESTDSELVKRVSEIVGDLFPKCKIFMRDFYKDTPYRLEANKLNTFDGDLGLELIRVLCEMGWEPFSGGKIWGTPPGLDVHFRIQLDKVEK